MNTTNILGAVVYVFMATNIVHLHHPSGEEKSVIKVSVERHVIEYVWEGKVMRCTNDFPFRTNATKFIWREESETNKMDRSHPMMDGPPPLPK